MTATAPALNVRADFPFLQYSRERPLIYFDNAATTQKPQVVLDAIHHLYASGIANVHRAGNFLSHSVTEQFEDSRLAVASFLGAEPNEIIFVSNATQGFNTLCSSLARTRPIKVLAATLEHHSNFLPWFDRGEVIPLPWKPTGEIDLAALDKHLRSKPDLLAVTYASNFLGTLQPVQEIIAQAHRFSVPVLIDASQAAAHIQIDVRALDCDYLVFSGHKVYGPSGIGVLFVRSDHMNALRPATLGGGMVKEVHRDGYVLNDVPLRFEAGTPHIEGAIGLAAALRYLESLGFDAVAAHEQRLTQQARGQLAALPGVEIFGPAPHQPSAPVLSFQIKGLESFAVEKVLAGRGGIVVRSGFHCAQPAHDALRIGPTVRVSFGVYNTLAEVSQMIELLHAVARYIE